MDLGAGDPWTVPIGCQAPDKQEAADGDCLTLHEQAAFRTQASFGPAALQWARAGPRPACLPGLFLAQGIHRLDSECSSCRTEGREQSRNKHDGCDHHE